MPPEPSSWACRRFFQPREFLPQETFLQRRQDIPFQGLSLAGCVAVVKPADMALGIDQHPFPAGFLRRPGEPGSHVLQCFSGTGQEAPLLPVGSGRGCVLPKNVRRVVLRIGREGDQTNVGPARPSPELPVELRQRSGFATPPADRGCESNPRSMPCQVAGGSQRIGRGGRLRRTRANGSEREVDGLAGRFFWFAACRRFGADEGAAARLSQAIANRPTDLLAEFGGEHRFIYRGSENLPVSDIGSSFLGNLARPTPAGRRTVHSTWTAVTKQPLYSLRWYSSGNVPICGNGPVNLPGNRRTDPGSGFPRDGRCPCRGEIGRASGSWRQRVDPHSSSRPQCRRTADSGATSSGAIQVDGQGLSRRGFPIRLGPRLSEGWGGSTTPTISPKLPGPATGMRWS